MREGRNFIVMELADGSPSDRLMACGPNGIPVDELLRYTLDAAEALDYLCSRQVRHRDVKPANIRRFGDRAQMAPLIFGVVHIKVV
jgi:serine/threonine protein kinase